MPHPWWSPWAFDKHMLPCGDCSQGKRRVACWRRGDDYRINMRQGMLDVGVCGDAVLRLLAAVTDLSEPLVDADDARCPGRGTEHADVLRSPITYSNDADSHSHRSHRHIPPFVFASGSGPFGVSPAVRSLAYLRLERHPRMSGRTYVRLG